MNVNLRQLKNNPALWIISGIILLLAIVVILLVLLVTRRDTSTSTITQTSNTESTSNSSDTTTNQNSGSNLNKGTVSNLSGGVTSFTNLKGLTLRINQIETCNESVVSAFVSVSAKSGDVNTEFTKQNVTVYLDNSKLSEFDFEPINPTKLPLASMLVIDKSGSMKGDPIVNAKSAATGFVDKLRTADQVGVIQFDTTVSVLSRVSTDKVVAKSAIAGITAAGDTAIYDALATAVTESPSCGRKAIVVLSDGEDTASKNASVKSVIDAASKANLPIFSVGIKSSGFDPNNITAISNATGGQYLEANTSTEVSNLYGKIEGQLSGQFVANLRMTVPKDGTVHTLKIVSNVGGSNTSSERSFLY